MRGASPRPSTPDLARVAGLCLALLATVASTGASTTAVAATASSVLEFLHVQNAGVALRCDGRTVLVDALVDLHEAPGTPPRPFDKLAVDALEDLLDGTSVVGCADLVLVTHGHPDHFCPATTSRYLRACPEAVVLTPDAASDEGRIRRLRVAFGAVDTATVAGLRLTALGLRHVSSGDAAHPMPHVGYVLHLGSWDVAHLGDAQGTALDLARLERALTAPRALLLIPYWFLEREGPRAWLQGRPPTDAVVLLHVDPWRRPDVEARVAELAPTIPGLLLPERHLEWTVLSDGR